MAIGVVSFSLLAILGSLSVGLNLAQDSSTSLVTTKVLQQVRGDISTLPFTATSEQPLTVNGLAGTRSYYTLDGTKCEAGEAYFEVSFEVNDPVVGGTASNFNGGARRITVLLTYPMGAPTANRQKEISSVLIARQSGS